MRQNKKNKKRSRLLKIILIEVILVVLLLIGLQVYGFLNKVNYDASEDDNILTNNIEGTTGYRNIVVFGVDSRSNALEKNTHSDTIMIVSINKKTKDIKLASIYRDTYTNIPEYNYNKINYSYFKGGYSLALSTINRNFDLDIKEYVTVNFSALVNAIDLLGGITLDIQKNELKYLNGYVRDLNRINGTNVPPMKNAGVQVVNGTQATAYARIRYTAGADFKRTERQRIVVSKMFEKLKSADLKTMNAMINDILPQTSTNLKSYEILNLAKDVLSYDIVGETGFPFEKDAHTYKKVSYVFPVDLAANVSRLHEFLFETENYEPSQTVKDYSAHIESIRKQ